MAGVGKCRADTQSCGQSQTERWPHTKMNRPLRARKSSRRHTRAPHAAPPTESTPLSVRAARTPIASTRNSAHAAAQGWNEKEKYHSHEWYFLYEKNVKAKFLIGSSSSVSAQAPIYCRDRRRSFSERSFYKTSRNIFTKSRNYDIMGVPNNLNIHSYRSFSLYGNTIAFFAI